MRDLGSNIRVAAISPGLVETEFQAAMYPDDPAAVSAIHSSVECLQSEDISAAVQCNTIIQYNIVQYNTVQYNNTIQ